MEVEGFQIDVARGRKPGLRACARFATSDIDEIRATRGLLRILPDDPEKLPFELRISIRSRSTTSVSITRRYAAQLINPKPKGFIRSAGWFGPWNSLCATLNAVSGDYEFTESPA